MFPQTTGLGEFLLGGNDLSRIRYMGKCQGDGEIDTLYNQSKNHLLKKVT